MRLKASYWIAGAIVVVAVVGAGGYYLSQRSGTTDQFVASVATPAGITVQRVGEKMGGYGGQGGGYIASYARRLAYGTANGMTLYTYDKDVEPGKSACTGDCAKAWPPATALPNAKPVGEWSIIARDDGTKQWARKGKPLYSFAKEEHPGDTKGDNAANGAWHTAAYKPASEMKLPYGEMISVQEVAEANGQALVDNRGMTLYALETPIDQDKQPACTVGLCSKHFTPMPAPELAKAVGDFTVITRHDDGTKQWAYHGKPLYTFDGDAVRGDVNGMNVDKRWDVALVESYFMPTDASIKSTVKGYLLADNKGMTLYRLDGYTFQIGGHNVHRAVPTRPAAGRAIGWKYCVGDCLKTWHPLQASPDAQPSGYWEIATRDDGTRQWVYQGYAMYTYAGDKSPGDLTGNDIYEYMISDDPTKVADNPTQMSGAGAVFWAFTSP